MRIVQIPQADGSVREVCIPDAKSKPAAIPAMVITEKVVPMEKITKSKPESKLEPKLEPKLESKSVKKSAKKSSAKKK
jgi:hypothetical protein